MCKTLQAELEAIMPRRKAAIVADSIAYDTGEACTCYLHGKRVPAWHATDNSVAPAIVTRMSTLLSRFGAALVR